MRRPGQAGAPVASRDGGDLPLRVLRLDLLPRALLRARDARARADGARHVGARSHHAARDPRGRARDCSSTSCRATGKPGCARRSCVPPRSFRASSSRRLPSRCTSRRARSRSRSSTVNSESRCVGCAGRSSSCCHSRFAACAHTPKAQPAQPAAHAALTPAEIAARALPAVVTMRTEQSLGTGFVVRADGWIATNLHVVVGGPRVEVTLRDGRDLDVVEVLAASTELRPRARAGRGQGPSDARAGRQRRDAPWRLRGGDRQPDGARGHGLERAGERPAESRRAASRSSRCRRPSRRARRAVPSSTTAERSSGSPTRVLERDRT